MRVGIVSDIHAQPGALEQALELLERRGADRIVCAGDIMDKGPDHDRVVELLLDWYVPSVLGNHDENALARAWDPWDLVLTDQTRAFLEDLPLSRSYEWFGQRILISHGTPNSNKVYFYENLTIPRDFRKWARRRPAEVVILGHTHRPMAVNYRGIWVLNPGSVSGLRPRDSHTCALLDLEAKRYEVLGIEGGRVEDLFTLER